MKSKRNCRPHPRSGFTHEEDCHLVELVRRYGTNSWVTIASKMEKRNARQCKDRYTSYLSPNINNGPYTKEEDELLEQKYNEIGPKWVKISKFFLNRTDISIKCRWAVLNRKKLKEKEKSLLSSDTNDIIKNESDDASSDNDSSFAPSSISCNNSSNNTKRNNIISSKKIKNTRIRNSKRKCTNDSESLNHKTNMTIRKRNKRQFYNYDDDFEDFEYDEFDFFDQKIEQNDDSNVLQSSNKEKNSSSSLISTDTKSLTSSPEPNLNNVFQSNVYFEQKKVTSPPKVHNIPIFEPNYSLCIPNNNSFDLNSSTFFNSKKYCDIFVDNHHANEEEIVDEFYWDFYWDVHAGKNETPINLFYQTQATFE